MTVTARGSKSAVIAATGAGTHTLVAEVSGKKIVVEKIHVSSSAAISVTLVSSDGTVLAGPIPLAQNSGFTWPADGEEWGHTTAGYALQIVLSGAATIGGYVGYHEE